MSSLTIGLGIVELSPGKALVYCQTDGRSGQHVQSNILLFFERGIIN